MAPLFRADEPLIRTGIFNRTRLLALLTAAALFAGGATLVGNLVFDDGSGSSGTGASTSASPRLGPDELRDVVAGSDEVDAQSGTLDRLFESAAEVGTTITTAVADVVDSVVDTVGDVSRDVVAAARDAGGRVIDTVMGAGDAVSVADRENARVQAAIEPATEGATVVGSSDQAAEVNPDQSGALRPGSTPTTQDPPSSETEETTDSGETTDAAASEEPSDDPEEPTSSDPEESDPEESPSPDPSESPTEEPSPSDSPDESPTPSPSESPTP